MRKKPTRTDLLAVVESLQMIVSQIRSAASDRNPNRAAHIDHLTRSAHQLCFDARQFDGPEAGARSKWKTRIDLTGVA